MNILSIGYVGFAAAELQPWRQFATGVMATSPLELRAPDGRSALGLRLDGLASRFLITRGPDEAEVFFGFEVSDADALATAADELARCGHRCTPATDEEIAFRQVEGMRHFVDPDGYRVELFHGLATAGPFEPTRPVSGYRTGHMGFGHAVILVSEMAKMRRLYCDVMGFRVSDFISHPNLRVFLHVNRRHHSLAFAERPGHGIAHLMVEVNELDDVGRTYDLVMRDQPDAIFSTLGRHSNDHMISFYVRTPSGIPLEYGWGGRLVDDETWQPGEVFGPSLWGHDRLGAASAARDAADRQREFAFANGLRAPLPFADPVG